MQCDDCPIVRQYPRKQAAFQEVSCECYGRITEQQCLLASITSHRRTGWQSPPGRLRRFRSSGVSNSAADEGGADAALGHLRVALEINPSDAESYAAFGTALVYAGEIDEAVKAIETANRLEAALSSVNTRSAPSPA